ncbi:ubiquitin-like domain-containing protein [Solibacillus sp. FSL W7-1324]|uniref:ubiquitin-like domain-containing protein n=1 Tax=Solibacillus sp. FSL W7-1324 TaxID=2921701 RepID=UPI0030F6BA6F
MSNDNLIEQLLSPRRKAKRKLAIGIVSALLLLVIGVILFQITKVDVKLVTNEGERIVSTHANTVERLLGKQKIDVSKHDKVSPSLDTKIEKGMTIQWQQAKPVKINLNGEMLSIWTTKTAVRDILQEANIDVSDNDKLSLPLDSEIDKNREIDILQAFDVAIIEQGERRNVRSTVTSVSNLLKEQGVTLGELDKVNYRLDSKIHANMKIEIIRVEKVTKVVEETLSYATEKQRGLSLLKGESELITKGKNGQKKITYEIVKENGKPVVKYMVSEEVTKEPVTEVILIGTKVPEPVVAAAEESIIRANSNDLEDSLSNYSSDIKVENEPTASKEELIVEATAYTPFCTGCSGTTKMGINVRLNTNIKVIAVDPTVIPLGSRVWVEGYGFAIAGDIGSDIKNNRIDVLVHSNTEAFKWGRKQVRLKIL